ncbi:MAG TPA: nuclear transport factor 2 family protein [Anaerolineales bacterium]|nr:nuclear transport factor 2 family protein [Anaerolineales bacterium]
MTESEFEGLMQTLADGWNEGDARKAADCFSDDAIYVEPPKKQLYHGRAELYEFFGGDHGTDIPMNMTWHHLAFNEQEQIGFGEYTFEMHRRYHGIVVVKIEAGRIKHWREYQYQTGLNWKEFTQHNQF